MERNEISHHECRFFVVLKKNKDKWMSHKELATEAKISERTARAYTLKFVKLGLLDVAEVFPAHRYRYAEKASKRNTGYVDRLERVCEVFGIAEVVNA
jgi:hypothetical protein